MVETWVGVDLHLRSATACRYEDGQMGAGRSLTLHGQDWERNWEALPAGAHVVVEMSRTTCWFAC